MISQGSTNHGTFGLVLCCIDGRNIGPLQEWLKKHFPEINHVDYVTAPGLDGILSGSIAGQSASDRQMTIKTDAFVSLSHHHPQFVIVSGHEDCAGNPVSRERHLEDIKKSVEAVRGWDEGFAALPIIGLYVERNGDEWVVGECVTGNAEA